MDTHVRQERTLLWKRIVCLALDAGILTLAAVLVVVALTAGGVVHLGDVRIRVRTTENPFWILTALLAVRYAARAWQPFLGIRGWELRGWIDTGAAALGEWLPSVLTRLARRPIPFITAAAASALAVKIFHAWTLPGFFSGDDVEIHEMSIGALWGTAWPIWDLRCALYPMTLIYPVQRVAWEAGLSTPEALVFAGRVVVAVLSTAALPLTWIAARRLIPDDPRVAALAVVLVGINKLQMSFGSSELPRPVSTVCVLAAFVLTLGRGTLPAFGAGICLGLAAAMRFSEIVFLAPAVVVLARLRQSGRAAVLTLAAVGTAAALTAAADLLYWGAPFSSVRAAIEFTLIERQSSRGFQPPWAYLTLIPAWTTVAFAALAIAGSRRGNADAWWCWLPVAILSLLPHKESRYLIPVVPFLSIAAARGMLLAAAWVRGALPPPGLRRWTRDLLAPLILLSVVHEIGGWRLPRSNEGVRLAQQLRASTEGLAVEDAWRLGGRLYLWHHDPLVYVTPGTLADAEATGSVLSRARFVALRSRTARTAGDRVLPALGFEREPGWAGEDYVLYVRRSVAERPQR